MTKTVSQAVEQRDTTPGELIKQYSTSFAAVLPTHIKSDTWVRLAQGALKRGKRTDGDKGPFQLEVAAANNPGVFLAALLDAARLGLEPGTEQYYLTPRKVKGRLEILGIVGYQGHIELIYRAGAVSSVVVQVVCRNDTYRYDRGVDRVPEHRFPPFARDAERGEMVGVYAYAHMKDGAISQVIELNVDDIERIKKSSQGSGDEYSPWRNHTKAMWLKSAVRQLQKWVPTSAEFRMELARALAEAQRVTDDKALPSLPPPLQDDTIDGEVVDAADTWPEVTTPPEAGTDGSA
jgi:recombination protein RecT